jgi:DNA topoisomerase-2
MNCIYLSFASSPHLFLWCRYIYTKLAPLTRLLVPEEDDDILQYRDDDGVLVEPVHYVPIIPMLLVNGADGIGTGWSTHVPLHNPLDLLDNLIRRLEWVGQYQQQQGVEGQEGVGEAMQDQQVPPPFAPMLPWAKGFKGWIGPKAHWEKAKKEQQKRAVVMVEEEGGMEGGKKLTAAAKKKAAAAAAKLEAAEEAGMELLSAEELQAIVSVGRVTRGTKKNTLELDELPLGRWTHDQKEMLVKMLGVSAASKAKAKAVALKSLREHHTEREVGFTVGLAEAELRRAERSAGGLEAAFKVSGEAEASSGVPSGELYSLPSPAPSHTRSLPIQLVKPISLDNMHAFDEHGRIQRYSTAVGILDAFYPIRLQRYQQRLEWQLKQTRIETRRLGNRLRFVEEVLSGDLKLMRGTSGGRAVAVSKAELVAEMREKGYETVSAFEADLEDTGASRDATTISADGGNSAAEGLSDYDYLLNMRVLSFTGEQVHSLQQQVASKEEALHQLLQTSASAMWLKDLRRLRTHLTKDPEYLENRRFTE